MPNLHVKYILIGGGLAASSAAKAIRAIDPVGELMMLGQEVNRPYHRPPLSKEYLRREKPREEVFVVESAWFAENHVQLRTGSRATHLDTARETITLGSGEEISFDKLLLATGASAKHLDVPGGELANVFYLRTLEDSDRLHHAVEKAKVGGLPHPRGRGRATVIGGGVLGVELAASLTQIGLAVDLVVASAYPWNRFADETLGKFLVHYLEKNGVTVHLDRRPQRLDGDGRVQRVVLDDQQSIVCDFVVPSVGAVINRDLLRGTSIASETAILVDDRCRTSDPNIFAAGDCCAVFDPLFGKHRMLDHWDNAMVTGTIAGTNMAGGSARYDAVNYFFSDVFKISLSGWGEARQAVRRLTRGVMTVESPDIVQLGIGADGRIAQILAINHSGEDELLKELVHKRVRIEGDEERLKDPSVGLGSLL